MLTLDDWGTDRQGRLATPSNPLDAEDSFTIGGPAARRRELDLLSDHAMLHPLFTPGPRGSHHSDYPCFAPDNRGHPCRITSGLHRANPSSSPG